MNCTVVLFKPCVTTQVLSSIRFHETWTARHFGRTYVRKGCLVDVLGERIAELISQLTENRRSNATSGARERRPSVVRDVHFGRHPAEEISLFQTSLPI